MVDLITEYISKLKPVFYTEKFSVLQDASFHNRVIATITLDEDEESVTNGLYEVRFLPKFLAGKYDDDIIVFSDVNSALAWLLEELQMIFRRNEQEGITIIS